MSRLGLCLSKVEDARRSRQSFTDGSMVKADVPLSLGHPGNPMGWSELETKFGRSGTQLGQKPYPF